MSRPTPAPRRPYRAPEVTVHGTLADLTLLVGNKGKLDSGASNSKKTSA